MGCLQGKKTGFPALAPLHPSVGAEDGGKEQRTSCKALTKGAPGIWEARAILVLFPGLGSLCPQRTGWMPSKKRPISRNFSLSLNPWRQFRGAATVFAPPWALLADGIEANPLDSGNLPCPGWPGRALSFSTVGLGCYLGSVAGSGAAVAEPRHLRVAVGAGT